MSQNEKWFQSMQRGSRVLDVGCGFDVERLDSSPANAQKSLSDRHRLFVGNYRMSFFITM